MKLDHHLIGIQPFSNVHMHGYVMSRTGDRDALRRVMSKMLDEAEKLCAAEGARFLPIVLTTKLDRGGAALVRGYLRKEGTKEIRDMLAAAKHFHFTLWLMSSSDPLSEQLWDLH